MKTAKSLVVVNVVLVVVFDVCYHIPRLANIWKSGSTSCTNISERRALFSLIVLIV